MSTVKVIEKQQEVCGNRDEPNDFPANDDNANPITNYGYFKYKPSITGKILNTDQENGENTKQENTKTKKNLGIVVPLKHLSIFWRTLDMPLINCEINLFFTCSENSVLTDIITKTARNAHSDSNPPVQARERIDAPTNATFQIIDTILYVPVVTLSIEDGNKLLEQLKSWFKRNIKWNKYRTEMTKQTKTKNLNYLIDKTFNKANRLFVLSFEN